MSWFLLCVVTLIVGYFTYGTFITKIFAPKPQKATPAMSMNDGVDFVPLSDKKVYLIQLLNIAGLGPIFGPILGALYGPVAMLWIVFGCIFAGAVHDYFSGMLSVRANGASVPSVVGEHLGNFAKHFMNFFAVLLLMLVGVVFVLGPAKLLGSLSEMSVTMWVGIIFAYYVLATVVPIDKIIGRFYPIFGALLVFMSVGLIIGLAVSDHSFYSQGLDVATNFHPTDLPLWPLLFITIACGAVSGFHATQSPLMARCMQNEKSGRFIFYGAMIMLWAAAAYLIKRDKLHWVCTIPAMFMTAVTVTYLANAEIGFSLPMNISTMIGVGTTLAATIAFLIGYKPNAQLIAEEK